MINSRLGRFNVFSLRATIKQFLYSTEIQKEEEGIHLELRTHQHNLEVFLQPLENFKKSYKSRIKMIFFFHFEILTL